MEKQSAEYFKAPFGKRMISILAEVLLLSFGTFLFLFLSRLVVESMPLYTDSFATYIGISKDSGLYVCDDSTENNLVTLTEYYGEKDYQTQNQKIEEALTRFYTLDEFFSQDSSSKDYGPLLYFNMKIGDSAIGKDDGDTYFMLDASGNPQQNPSYTEEKMNSFYLTAYDKSVAYLQNNESYLQARNTLTIYINLVLIPLSIVLSFLVFELLLPMTAFRRGKQTIGMKLMKLSLLGANALSPSWKRYLGRQMLQLFLIILLSMVSFGIPLIVSFSMMLFRKDGQSLADYLAGTYMVDSSEQSVYLSYEEMENLQKKAASRESNPLLPPEKEKREMPLGEDSIWRDLRDK